jgi:hypothetical protein
MQEAGQTLLGSRLKRNSMKLHPQNPTPGIESKPVVTYTKNEPHNQPAYYGCFFGSSLIGTIDQEVDGYYYFYPALRGGFWASHLLHDVAHKLDALNEAWNQRIEQELNKLPPPHSPCTEWTPKTLPTK